MSKAAARWSACVARSSLLPGGLKILVLAAEQFPVSGLSGRPAGFDTRPSLMYFRVEYTPANPQVAAVPRSAARPHQHPGTGRPSAQLAPRRLPAVACAAWFLSPSVRFSTAGLVALGKELDEAGRVARTGVFRRVRENHAPLVRDSMRASVALLVIYSIIEISSTILLFNRSSLTVPAFIWQGMSVSGTVQAFAAATLQCALIGVVLLFAGRWIKPTALRNAQSGLCADAGLVTEPPSSCGESAGARSRRRCPQAMARKATARAVATISAILDRPRKA